jgi:hypothetical protein
VHPDDAPRPPILAGRDLPPLGLGPVASQFAVPETADWHEGGELILADLAPVEITDEDEAPWLQPAEPVGAGLPDPADGSIGAMVARFESGLAYRRRAPAAAPAFAGSGVALAEEVEPDIDFALEAALSTLQRMNRDTVG